MTRDEHRKRVLGLFPSPAGMPPAEWEQRPRKPATG